MKLTIYENKKRYEVEYRGIYSINFDNGKRYIGMAERVKERLWEHYKSKNDLNDNLPVHCAMRKHNFEFELLEECNGTREQMGEREKYWISFYKTYCDKNKGYNLTPGGDGASVGVNNISAKLNEKQIQEIYDLLINDKTKFIYQIAAMYNISSEAISEINLGKRYFNKNLKYPLRDSHFISQRVGTGIDHHLASFKTQEEIDYVYEELKNSNLTLRELAKKYNVSYTTISKINRGLEYQKENYEYPVRKVKRNLKISQEKILEIYDTLINSEMSLKAIGEQYNLSQSTIIRINKGTTYKQENYSYPIRANKEINKAVSTISGSGE